MGRRMAVTKNRGSGEILQRRKWVQCCRIYKAPCSTLEALAGVASGQQSWSSLPTLAIDVYIQKFCRKWSSEKTVNLLLPLPRAPVPAVPGQSATFLCQCRSWYSHLMHCYV